MYSKGVGAEEELMQVERWGSVEVGTIRNFVNMLTARNSPACLSYRLGTFLYIPTGPFGHALPPVPIPLLPNTSSSSLLSAIPPLKSLDHFTMGTSPRALPPSAFLFRASYDSSFDALLEVLWEKCTYM